jgi:dTDP-4-dehydrorhamnose 3,5-epimerase
MTGIVPRHRGEAARVDYGARCAIVGVSVRPIEANVDRRGSLSEVHRDEWDLAPRPVPWDFIFSHRNVLRGVHVHLRRWHYLIVLDGRATIGLNDVRRTERSFGRTVTIDVAGERPTVVTIPPGVAHSIYAHTELKYLYGLTVAWDGSDEDLGCRHDDPGLAIEWPSCRPIVLPHDLELADYATLLRDYERATAAEAAETASV